MTVSLDWPLCTQPDTPQMPVVDPPPVSDGELVVVVGGGVLRPFQRDQKNDIANASGVKVILANVGQVLGTMAQSPHSMGELPWRPEFGSWLYLLRQRRNSVALQGQAQAFVADAIQRWEPRVRVRGVEFSPQASGQGAESFRMRVSFNIVDDGGRVLTNASATVGIGV